jgi:NDP-sugar pyrophosphorylase family protein
MGDLTAATPKPMLPVRNRPVLEHVLENLSAAGVRRFLVVVGYQRELVEAHFSNWRLPVEFRTQDPVDGTGSAARLAREFTGGEPFLLTYGDILCEPAAYLRCAAAVNHHSATAAVLGVKAMDDPWRGAAVYAEADRITRVIEKPPRGTSATKWGSAGVYAFRPLVFKYLDRLPLSDRNEYELTSVFEMMLADDLDLRIAALDGTWRDIGRPEDLAAANAEQT